MILASTFHTTVLLSSNLIWNFDCDYAEGAHYFLFRFVPSKQNPACVLFISRCSRFTMPSESPLLLLLLPSA